MNTNNSKLLIKTIWIQTYRIQTTVSINKNNMNTNNSKLLIKTIWIQTTVIKTIRIQTTVSY